MRPVGARASKRIARKVVVLPAVLALVLASSQLLAGAWTQHPYHQSAWQPFYGCSQLDEHRDVSDWALNAISDVAVNAGSACGVLQWRDKHVVSGGDTCYWSDYHYDYGTATIHSWVYDLGELLSSCGYSEFVTYQLPYYTYYGPLWLF